MLATEPFGQQTIPYFLTTGCIVGDWTMGLHTGDCEDRRDVRPQSSACSAAVAHRRRRTCAATVTGQRDR